MRSVNEINQKIEELRKCYRQINRKFPPKDNVDGDVLINELLSDLSSQVRILKWVLE